MLTGLLHRSVKLTGGFWPLFDIWNIPVALFSFSSIRIARLPIKTLGMRCTALDEMETFPSVRSCVENFSQRLRIEKVVPSQTNADAEKSGQITSLPRGVEDVEASERIDVVINVINFHASANTKYANKTRDRL